MKRILLGSGSPRRKELLARMDIDFRVVKLHEVEEVYPEDMTVDKVPAYLSRLKAESYIDDLNKDDLLITADTVVIVNDEILGKPKDEEDAIRMLMTLSGNTHKVITGVSLTTIDGIHTFDETTKVEFSELSNFEIREYVTKYKPMDKAGAYGIQEWIGMVAIKRVEGCFYNVMGLPTASLYREIKQLGAI